MKALLFVLFATTSLTLHAQTELPPGVPRIRWSPNPTFTEEGFRLGYMLRVEARLLWNFEGKFMMGFGSSPEMIRDRECEVQFTQRIQRSTRVDSRLSMQDQMNELCSIEANPWRFSMVSPVLFDRFRDIGLVPVVVYYTRSTNSIFGATRTRSLRAFTTDTLNYVQDVFPTNPASPAPTFYHVERGELPVAQAINPAAGFVEGRVVKASLSHFIRKSYEITFQLGSLGNNYLRLSVNTQGMFDHLVLAMLTGEVVRLSYVRLFEVHAWLSSILYAYSTNYRVTSVEILRTGEPPVPPNVQPSEMEVDEP
ncbi:MAG: hypothetical protein KF799_10650 [Bdellovibrionales bacterium]|nr:hypothetical protein [Bdellovibrionales bacterium]